MREPDFVDACYADKDLSLLKKLTLVIPTYNRNYYLSRCLWYHAHFPFGEIIVADSSPEEKKVVNRETVAKVREMFGANIRYLEYEPETEKYGGDIYRKWGDAVQHVETEYSQICTDKEFLIPTTLCECVNYLDNNIAYIATSGVFGYVYYSINNIYALSSSAKNRTSIIDSDPLNRYKSAIYSGYNQSLLLSLYRTSIHKGLYRSYLDSEIADIRFGERYIALIGYIYGCTYYFVSDMFNIRDIVNLWNHGDKPDKVESSAIRYPTIYELSKNKELFTQHHEYFATTVIKQLSTVCNIPWHEAKTYYYRFIDQKLSRHEINYPNYEMGFWNMILKMKSFLMKHCYSLLLLLNNRMHLHFLEGFNVIPIPENEAPESLKLIQKIIIESIPNSRNDFPININSQN